MGRSKAAIRARNRRKEALMSDSPLVWFNEARQRWVAVCPLRRCPWHVGDPVREFVEKVQRLHAGVCPGR